MMVRVESEAAETGDFFIYQWWSGLDGPNEDGAFGDYVQSVDALLQYLIETGWVVDWDGPMNHHESPTLP